MLSATVEPEETVPAPVPDPDEERERARTPDLFSWLLPPVAASLTKKNDDLRTDERNDGGMFFFVPILRFVRVAALVLLGGVVAGLCMLAIVYLSSAIEGQVMRATNAAGRSADAELNSALAPKPLVLT